MTAPDRPPVRPLSLRARTLLRISEQGARHGARRGQPIELFGHDLNAAQALVRQGLGELNDRVFHATHKGLRYVWVWEQGQ